MQVEDFKTWHWVALGLLAGLAFSVVLAMAGPSFASDDLDTIDAATFEHALLGELVAHRQQGYFNAFHRDLPKDQLPPVIRDIVVHPPLRGDNGRVWVTGKIYWIQPRLKDPANARSGEQMFEQWRPFKFPTETPYKGMNGPKDVTAASYPNITGYLAALKQKVPTARYSFRFAWQDTPALSWTLPPMAGLLTIGVAWPLSLGIMQRWGMAPTPKVAQPKPQPAPEPMPVIKPVAAVRIVPPPQPVAPKPAPLGDDKEYGGEFYPVAKGSHHE